MALKNPSVVRGARGPRETRPPTSDSPQGQAVGIPDNEVWYQASYSRLRIQLTAPQDERFPDGRIRTTAPIVAQFEGAMLKLRLDKEKDARIAELLEQHEQKGVLFWNFQDALDKAKADKREQVLSVLEDPEQAALIAEALAARGVDFALPKGGAKPETDEDGSVASA